MFRYRLRTLLIVLALLPPALAAGYFLSIPPRVPDDIGGCVTDNGDGTVTVVKLDMDGKLLSEVRPVLKRSH